MSISDYPEVAQFRAEASALFLEDRVLVTRIVGFGVDANGDEGPISETVYSGAARLVRNNSRPGVQEFATVEFPYGAYQAEEGDIVEWLASPDVWLLGNQMVVSGELPSTTHPVVYRVMASRGV